jgi:hypothetical protein
VLLGLDNAADYAEAGGVWHYRQAPGGGARAAAEAQRHHNNDPHLRSCQEVIKYHIQASDGDIGHLQSLLIEEDTWAIRYLIVKTRRGTTITMGSPAIGRPRPNPSATGRTDRLQPIQGLRICGLVLTQDVTTERVSRCLRKGRARSMRFLPPDSSGNSVRLRSLFPQESGANETFRRSPAAGGIRAELCRASRRPQAREERGCLDRRNLLIYGGKAGNRTLDPGIMIAVPKRTAA